MNENRKPELLIDGIGSSSGGEYFRVRINGRGKVLNDLDCTYFSCNGFMHIDGNLQAKKAEINGALTIENDFIAEELVVYGKTNVHGSISVDLMHIEGDISVKNHCTAKRLQSRGRMQVNGLLQAESVQMTIYGTSRLTEINGKTIQIKRGFDSP